MLKTDSLKQHIKDKNFLRALRLLGVIVLLIIAVKMIYIKMIEPELGKSMMLEGEAVFECGDNTENIALSSHYPVSNLKNGDKITVSFEVPKIKGYNVPVLEFKGFYCYVSCTVEDEAGKKKEYNEKRDAGINGLVQGFKIYRFPLEREQKQKVTVEFEAGDDYAMSFVPDFYVKDGLTGVKSFISSHITKTMISIFMMILGLAIIFFGFFNRNLNVENRRLMWLGCVYVFISTWVILISGIMQLVTVHFRYCYYIEYLSLAMSFVCLSMYLAESSENKFIKIYCTVNSVILLVLMALFITLDLTGVLTLHRMLTVIRVFLLLMFFSVFYYCYEEKKLKHKNINYIIFGIALMIAIFVMEVIANNGSLARYEFAKGYLPFAICIFMVMFMMDNVSGLARFYMNRGEKQFLERLAYEDALTHLPNRLACEMELSRIEEERGNKYILMMLDVNGLKYVNDNYGHKAGDELLKNMGRVVRNAALQCDGMAGRFGGDEFIAVIPIKEDDEELNGDKELERIGQVLKKERARVNRENKGKYELNFSYGFSIYASGSQESAWKILMKADNNMYDMKKLGGSSK